MADSEEEILREIELADVERIRARNYILGRFGFMEGEEDPARYPEAREMLEELGLDWKTPPGTMPIKDLASALEIDPRHNSLRSRRA